MTFQNPNTMFVKNGSYIFNAFKTHINKHRTGIIFIIPPACYGTYHNIRSNRLCDLEKQLYNGDITNVTLNEHNIYATCTKSIEQVLEDKIRYHDIRVIFSTCFIVGGCIALL